MDNITLIVLAAGNSTRFNSDTKKQWIRIEDDPLWLYVTNRLSKTYDYSKIIVVGNQNELNYMKNFSDEYIFVAGGEQRQDSMQNALKSVDSEYVMITDVARACVPEDIIQNLISSKDKADCIVPYLPVSDTVVFQNDTIDRDEVKLIQTPQLSRTSILKDALKQDIDFTDDSSAIKNIGGSIEYILGSKLSTKITFGEELDTLSCLKEPKRSFFNGSGFDIHPFEDGKNMYLGGIHIDNVEYGFKAHSDGDVLIHSLIDAILGACGAGDIGEFFPDNDDKYKNIDSKILLKDIIKFVKGVGYELINIDLTIVAQKPRINSFKNSIKSSISDLCALDKRFINIKATTAEKLGFIGRGEGVAVISSATLKYFEWK